MCKSFGYHYSNTFCATYADHYGSRIMIITATLALNLSMQVKMMFIL
jgi:hypothetical protein